MIIIILQCIHYMIQLYYIMSYYNISYFIIMLHHSIVLFFIFLKSHFDKKEKRFFGKKQIEKNENTEYEK